MRRLGSTEIAAVSALFEPKLALELPKSKTAGDVWLRLVAGIDMPKRKPMQRGLDMEPWALAYYAEHFGPWWREKPLGEWWTIAHPNFEWATASPDAYDSPEARRVIEIKTQSEWARKQWGMPGTDEMATRYLYQCAWLMACSGAAETHVLCVFGNDTPDDGFVVTEPAAYRVERDESLETSLLVMGERFWSEFVLTGQPPPVRPAANRREMKRVLHERGVDVKEWERRCDERGEVEEQSGDEAGGGDGGD